MRIIMNTLEIKNFGPIRDVNVVIRPLTVFIGQQGCGKSTISKVYTICQDVQWVLDVLQGKDTIIEPFEKLGISEFFQKDTFIRYTVEEDYPYEIQFDKAKFSVKNKSHLSDEKFKASLLYIISESNKALLSRIGITESELSKLPNQYSALLRANARLVLYVPAERNLIGNLSPFIMNLMLADIPLNGSLKEYMSIYERAKAKYPSFDVPFLSVRFTQESGKEKLYISENKAISFYAGSSGIQSVLPMLMVIKYSCDINCFNCFVIEEPEQNLYPMNQYALLRSLLSYRSRYILTTHSPYLLAALNVFLLAGNLVKDDRFKEEVYNIIPENETLNPDDVAVYAINKLQNEPNLINLIDSKTGLIDVNSLDGVSEYISDIFDQLMRVKMNKTKSK